MKKLILAFILLLSILLISGCSQKTGTLVMQITDAPPELNIEKAIVTISGVEVHIAGDDENLTDNASIGQTGWFTVVEEPKTFDLIEIKDVKMFLGTANLTEGMYTQIRLNIDQAVVTIDGDEHDLKVPSEKLKLVKGFDIAAGQTTILTLDFDAQESIVQAGDKYNLKPTIKIIEE